MNLNTLSGEALPVSEAVFAREFNEALCHQVVQAILDNQHFGTKKQKTRSEVRGGGRKPWKQKGTGRARAGTRSSPIWRSGGVNFAARPVHTEKKINKKMYFGAMRSVLSEIARQERLVVTEEFKLETHKTKELVAKLHDLGLTSVLIVVDDFDDQLELAARNIPKVYVALSSEIDPLDLISFERVLMTVPAIRQLEEKFS